MANYRFYLLNQRDHITKAQVAECEGVDDVQRMALLLLTEHQVAAAIEAWERDRLVYRAERPKTDPGISVA